jgi:AP2 domain
MLNIRRVDHDASSTHCWRVTVQRRKRIFVRDFSDGRHGGRQAALQDAQLYRDKLVKAYPPLSKATYCAIRKKNNRSGISGLMRVDKWQVHNGRRARRLYWEAQWPIGNGKARHQKFSITKYGEEGAKRKALAARRAALKALATQTFPSLRASL